MGTMSVVTHVVTVVDLDLRASTSADDEPVFDGRPLAGWTPVGAPDRPELSGGHPYDPNQMNLSVAHLAVLADGHRVTLIDDRGWGGSGVDIWRVTSVEEIQETARVVVGPDEGDRYHSPADMETDHWADLAETLHRQGVRVEAEELPLLPHEVELSPRLLARLSPS